MKDWGWDERELVRRCKEGSEAGYAELVRQHRPRLYTLAYRLTNHRETAEDVVQETFIAAFRAMERFQPNPSLAAWLNTIALRLASRAAATRRGRPSVSLESEPSSEWFPDAASFLASTDPAYDPHAAAEASELRIILAHAIADLPIKMRAAVVLRHVLGLEYAEAASVMGVPLNTYKSHLLRGTRLLRDAIKRPAGQAMVPVPPTPGRASGARAVDSLTPTPKARVERPGAGPGAGGNGREPHVPERVPLELTRSAIGRKDKSALGR